MFIDNKEFKLLAKTDKSIKPALRKASIGNVTVLANRSVKFVYSTPSMDRDYDIIMQEGIDLLTYATNPVVFFAHNHDSMPIGKTTHLAIENGNLTGIIEFVSEDNPAVGKQAEGVFQLIRDGFLNAVSIGFIATAWSEAENEERYVRDGVDITSCELVEVSIVGIPSNRHALVQEIATDKVIEPIAAPIEVMDPALIPDQPKKFNSARLKRLLSVMD